MQRHFSFLFCGLALLSSCGPPTPPPPSVTLKAITATAGKAKSDKIVALAGTVSPSGDGLYHFNVQLLDERGCRSGIDIEPISSNAKGVAIPFSVTKSVKLPFRVASISIAMSFWRMDTPPGEGSVVFQTERIVDPSLRPPSVPRQRCSRPPANDDERIDRMGDRELVATAINTAGYLCARVTDVTPSPAGLRVTCVEYRSGQGKVKYSVDLQSMTVTPD